MPYKINPFTGKFDNVGSGGSGDLESTLINGNTTGSNNIFVDDGFGIVFQNWSMLKRGTTDANLGGLGGISQICSLSYELKWDAGRLFVMGQDGFTIRWVLFQFNNTPTNNDDNTLGYVYGSRWTCDFGDTYICLDNTTGNAVWSLQASTSVLPIIGALSHETQTITLGNGKLIYRMPCAMTLTDVRLSLATAQASGNFLEVDITCNGTSIFSTPITIDNGTRTSVGASTPYVLATTYLPDDAEMSFNVTDIGNGSAAGLKCTIKGLI